MKIKVPKSIKVGGFDYKVIFKDGESQDGEKWGWWRNDPQEIEVRGDAPPQRFSSTFLHEVMHAVDDTYLGSKLVESDIVGLVAGLHQVLEQLNIRFVK